MENISENQAIEAALNADWETAVKLNNSILKEDPEDVNALLRLGYAHLQLNQLLKAQKAYKAVLKIKPQNNLALGHLEKIQILKKNNKKKVKTSAKIDPGMFLEIPGKTKSVHLKNLGHKEDLASLSNGEELFLQEKKRRLEVRTADGDYIGCLPDDTSKRLLYFIHEGSEYQAFVKDIDLHEMVIFIKEYKKGEKVKDYPSFPADPHILLSDVQQIQADDSDEDDEDDDDESEDIDIEEEEWGEIDEEQHELSRLVQVEDEDSDE